MTTNPDIEADIPNDVYKFFHDLNRAITIRDVSGVNELYEVQFESLTQNYYIIGPGQFRSWPSLSLKQVSENFKNPIAKLVYSFLYFKHLFTDRAVKQNHATDAWNTFTSIFAALIAGECDLPSWMLWDVFDEFVFQMTVVYQKRFIGQSEWAVAEAFDHLDRVIVGSGIMDAIRHTDVVEDMTKGGNSVALSGFFAVMTKCKISVLLGDYHAALSTLEPLDIFKSGKQVLQKVAPANISLLYNVGFSYFMTHRYDDASTNFRKCLSLKAGSRRFSERVQLDSAYLFICARVLGGMVVPNVSSLLDPRKVTAFEDDKESLRSGDEERFREVFERCSPKFLTVPSAGSNVKGTEGRELQARMFRRTVQQQQNVIQLRGYFGVYQNSKMSLLQTLLETNDSYAPLFAMKMRSRQLVHDGESANLLSGTYRVCSHFDCVIDGDNVDVTPSNIFSGMETKFLYKIKALTREQKQSQFQREQKQSQQRQRKPQQRQQNYQGRGNNARRNNRPAADTNFNLFNRNEL